ncbi:hypothetical protein ABE237_03190 [Brevibacillus formosus]|uniref:hypothetical protein n=1 Tax=Brevibacillus formosus TaxID=54913 RepID=UPI0018CDFC8A|nr:hypothetical protein [Brevibacillus formosus]MBG9941203.1 hypothetical protein [Brevibacillus formosus]
MNTTIFSHSMAEMTWVRISRLVYCRLETVKAALYDLFASVESWVLQKLFLVDVHGDRLHQQTLYEVIKEARAHM